MILVTVGSQMPFDRMIKTVEEWAIESNRDDVIFQVGVKGYCPKDYVCHELIKPEQFNKYFQEAELIISHAGMGTILKAIELMKTIIVMPRLSSLRETRNDHQVYTENKFSKYPNIYFANEFKDLVDSIKKISIRDINNSLELSTSNSLSRYIYNFIGSSLKRNY